MTPWNSSSPSRTSRRCSSGRSAQATSRGMPWRRAKRFISATSARYRGRFQGSTAPSARVFEGSGTTSSWSTSIRLPKPWQVGQAPKGLLNENSRGCGSSKAWPHRAHSKASENSSSGPSTTLTRARPIPSANAVVTASLTRAGGSVAGVSRSTTTRSGSPRAWPAASAASRSSTSSPARSRRNPRLRRRSTRSGSGVPPTGVGNRTMARAPAGSARMRSATVSAVSRDTTLAQVGQTVRPTFANSSLR
jgi:hypothetical protein